MAVTNTVVLNGGDAAIALALLDAIGRALPGAAVEVHDARPDVAARLFPSVRWRPALSQMLAATRRPPRGWRILRTLNQARLLLAARLWTRRAGRGIARALLRPAERRHLADFAAIDLLVSTGGTYLVEHYSLWPRLFEMRMARALGIPTIFYTQSLGPFANAVNRRTLRRAMAAAPLVLLRDERSRGHLLEIGVPRDRLEVVADAAFAGDPPAPPAPVARAGRGPRVAVSVRRWPPAAAEDGAEMRRYVDALAAAVTWLVRERGAEVVFVSTCQGIPEYWTDDSRIAQRLHDALDPDVRAAATVDRRFRAPDALVRELAGFDMALATRMHAGILALTAGTPVLAIAYEFKTTELFERMGLGDHVVPIDGIGPADLVARTRAFLDALADVAPRQMAAVARERAGARRAERLLAEAARGVAYGRGR